MIDRNKRISLSPAFLRKWHQCQKETEDARKAGSFQKAFEIFEKAGKLVDGQLYWQARLDMATKKSTKQTKETGRHDES